MLNKLLVEYVGTILFLFTMNIINNLFVYGTLQKGKQHESILKILKGSWKKGYVKGYRLSVLGKWMKNIEY